MTTKEYRSGVGLMILNKDRHIFMGERMDSAGELQMPQGGIDEGEEIEQAAFRELHEETGMTPKNTSIISSLEEWIYYDFPEELRNRIFNKRYWGQRQRWFLLEFHGEDSQIDLKAHDIQEFSSYQWICPTKLVDNVVPFKKDMYAKVVEHFKLQNPTTS